MAFALINLHQVRRRIPRSKSTLYAEIAAGIFPRPIKLGRGSYWRDDEVDELIDAYSSGASAQDLSQLCVSFYRRRLARREVPGMTTYAASAANPHPTEAPSPCLAVSSGPRIKESWL
jgi:prophage regulatory protein